MAEGKKSFVAYADWNGMFKVLPDEVAGKLIKHIFSYVNDENPITEDFIINALFEQIKSTLKRDLEKWESQLEQRRNAGKASAESRKNKANEINERSTVVDETERNPTVSVSVSVNDSVLLEKETKDIPPKKEVGFENLKNFWNETVSVTSIAKINEISDKRKKALKILFSIYPREKFIEVLNDAIRSDFLNGNNKNNFSMSFDWFIKKDNFLKVMEGNYKNKTIAPAKIIVMPKQTQKTIELTEEQKNEMRRQNGLID